MTTSAKVSERSLRILFTVEINDFPTQPGKLIEEGFSTWFRSSSLMYWAFCPASGILFIQQV